MITRKAVKMKVAVKNPYNMMVVKMIRMGHQLTDKLNNQLPLLTIQGMLQELEAQWLKCKMAKH